MKKWSIIGIIIVIIAILIWCLLKTNCVQEKESPEIIITWNTDNQEDLTWWIIIEDNDEWLTSETIENPEEQEVQEVQENQELEENENEVILEDDYPIYWVIETDYWDESISEEDESDPDLQETEKLLMQALSEWSQEGNNNDL